MRMRGRRRDRGVGGEEGGAERELGVRRVNVETRTDHVADEA